MIMNKYNYLWILILIAGIIGTFFLIKTAYANPLNLPDYAFTNPQIREAYTFAKMNATELDGFPCNCGCMASAHGGGRIHARGLIDCFMSGDINNGGAWDSHASECGSCYQDLLYVKKLLDEGKTKNEIKSILEEKYSTQKISNNTVY